MHQHFYDVVNSDGDFIVQIVTDYTNLEKREYFDKYIAGETLDGLSKAFGERVFVAALGGE